MEVDQSSRARAVTAGSLGIFLVSSALGGVLPMGLDPAMLTAVIAGAAMVAASPVQSASLPRPGELALPYALLLASMAAMLTAAPTAYGQTKSLGLMVTLPLTLLGSAYFVRRWEELRWLLGGMYLTSLLAVLVTIPAAITGTGLRLGVGGQGNIIGAGRAAGIVLLCSLIVGLEMPRNQRFRLGVVCGTAFAALPVLLASASRGPIFATVLAAATFIGHSLLRRRRSENNSRRRVVTTMVGLGAACLGAMYAFEIQISGRITRGFEQEVGRPEYARSAWKMGLDAPFGNGWGAFPVSVGDSGESYPHNLVLEYWAEAGIVPTLLLVSMLILGTARAARRKDLVGAAVLSLIVFAWINAAVSHDVVGNRLALSVLVIAVTFPPQKPVTEADETRGVVLHRVSGSSTVQGATS